MGTAGDAIQRGDQILARLLGDDASKLVTEATDLARDYPNDERAVIIAATVLRRSGDVDGALSLLTRLDSLIPGNAVVLANIAATLEQDNLDVDAAKYYWNSALASSNYVPAVYGYAQCTARIDGEHGYWNAIQQLASLPGAWVAPLIVVRDDLKHNRRSTVVRACKRLLDTVGDNPEPVDAIATMLSEAGWHQELNALSQFFNLENGSLATCSALVAAALECEDTTTARAVVNRSPVERRTDLELYSAGYRPHNSGADGTTCSRPPMSLMVVETAPWFEILGKPDWLFAHCNDDSKTVVFAPFCAPSTAPGLANTSPLGAVVRSIPFVVGQSLQSIGAFRALTLVLLTDGNIPTVPATEVSYSEVASMLRAASLQGNLTVTAALVPAARGLSFSYHLFLNAGDSTAKSTQKTLAVEDLRSAVDVLQQLEADILLTRRLGDGNEANVAPLASPHTPSAVACHEHLLRALIALRTAASTTLSPHPLPLSDLFNTVEGEDKSIYWLLQRAAAAVAAGLLKVPHLEARMNTVANVFRKEVPAGSSAFILGLYVRRMAGGDGSLDADIQYANANSNQLVQNWLQRTSLL